ncbi:cilia- and flagella-associated protein 298, partial [Nephila pilipes]
MELNREHFRAIIFHNFRRGLSRQECFDELNSLYSDKAPSYSTVKNWYNEFNRGRCSIQDESRAGRPKSVVVPEKINAVRELIKQDRHVTYREIEASLDISMTSINKILHEHLSVKKICSRWIPHNLTNAQKKARVDWCKEMLEKYIQGTSKAVYNIYTGDESWIYAYEPETKQQSTVWVFQDEAKPTKVVRGRSTSKQMIACFFGINGHVATVALEQRRTVNSEWYTTICLPEKMVKLHVKIGDQSLFWFETLTSVNIGELLKSLMEIHNGKLKIRRLCYEIEEMSKYGVSFPPNMQGLTQEQISDLKLKDDWVENNLTQSDYVINQDPMGKRNGFAPLEKYARVLTKTTAEAKARISQKMIEAGVCLTLDTIQETLEILQGAISICYPMDLPSYEIIKLELENKEDLSGTQASKEVLEMGKTELWWACKKLDESKLLCDYVGKNEKSKVIVKLQKKGHGAPVKEPSLTEQQKKDLLLAEHRRREEFKRLEIDDDDSHLDSQWADNN